MSFEAFGIPSGISLATSIFTVLAGSVYRCLDTLRRAEMLSADSISYPLLALSSTIYTSTPWRTIQVSIPQLQGAGLLIQNVHRASL